MVYQLNFGACLLTLNIASASTKFSAAGSGTQSRISPAFMIPIFSFRVSVSLYDLTRTRLPLGLDEIRHSRLTVNLTAYQYTTHDAPDLGHSPRVALVTPLRPKARLQDIPVPTARASLKLRFSRAPISIAGPRGILTSPGHASLLPTCLLIILWGPWSAHE